VSGFLRRPHRDENSVGSWMLSTRAPEPGWLIEVRSKVFPGIHACQEWGTRRRRRHGWCAWRTTGECEECGTFWVGRFTRGVREGGGWPRTSAAFGPRSSWIWMSDRQKAVTGRRKDAPRAARRACHRWPAAFDGSSTLGGGLSCLLAPQGSPSGSRNWIANAGDHGRVLKKRALRGDSIAGHVARDARCGRARFNRKPKARECGGGRFLSCHPDSRLETSPTSRIFCPRSTSGSGPWRPEPSRGRRVARPR